MKKLLILLCMLVLLCCRVPEDGSNGKRGKAGKTTIIEESKPKQIVLVCDGVTITDWQDIDLSMLQELNFIEIKFHNMENELKLCPELLKVSYQVDGSDIKTISIQYWQSIALSADKNTVIKWIGCPGNKKIKIYLIY
jgi:hypothetical protein